MKNLRRYMLWSACLGFEIGSSILWKFQYFSLKKMHILCMRTGCRADGFEMNWVDAFVTMVSRMIKAKEKVKD
ncbi:Katanin p60 ATPase-containing subunit A1 [Trifolium repens]|nr:Katanin p60 ATPase-containing subunit A1 [Trifolium repens]